METANTLFPFLWLWPTEALPAWTKTWPRHLRSQERRGVRLEPGNTLRPRPRTCRNMALPACGYHISVLHPALSPSWGAPLWLVFNDSSRSRCWEPKLRSRGLSIQTKKAGLSLAGRDRETLGHSLGAGGHSLDPLALLWGSVSVRALLLLAHACKDSSHASFKTSLKCCLLHFLDLLIFKINFYLLSTML